MKEEILLNILNCGSADLDMLEECNYDFDDIKEEITDCELDFNSILQGAFYIYARNLQSAISDVIENLENEMNLLDKDSAEKKELEEKKYALQQLDVLNDIEFFSNYLDTHLWYNENEDIYRKYLSEEIKKENKEIGFVSLDTGDLD